MLIAGEACPIPGTSIFYAEVATSHRFGIQYHAPQYGADGKRTHSGRIIVQHTGKRIHDNLELPDSPAAEKRRAEARSPVRVGRILLHYHNGPVR